MIKSNHQAYKTQQWKTFPLYYLHDLDIVIFWSSKDHSSDLSYNGFHFIIGINFASSQNPLLDWNDHLIDQNRQLKDKHKTKMTRSLFIEAETELINLVKIISNYNKYKNDNPVKFSLHAKDIFYFDFSSGK